MASAAAAVVKECKEAFPAAMHVLTASPQFAAVAKACIHVPGILT